MLNKLKRLIRGELSNEEKMEALRKEGVHMGSDCDIYSTASFGSEPYLITLGNHVRVNHNVTFVTHDGGVWVLREYLNSVDSKNIDLFGKIVVGNNVHIGTNAIIMPGVTIGNNCIIGCGAIVTKNIPDNSVAVGVPARVIESIDEYVSKHEKEFDFTVRKKNFKGKEKKKYLTDKYLYK